MRETFGRRCAARRIRAWPRIRDSVLRRAQNVYKCLQRGIRILMSACKIDRETAVHTIKSAGRSVPVALVMLKAKVDKPEAVRRLAKSDGNVRLAIEDNVLEL